MRPRLLLDTHILIWWLCEGQKLSREQSRVLEAAVRRGEPLAFSAVSLIEIAILVSEGKIELESTLREFLSALRVDPVFRVLPFTYEIAEDVALLRVLRDPADRTIAATARVHRLDLVTSDGRMIDSNLVPVVT